MKLKLDGVNFEHLIKLPAWDSRAPISWINLLATFHRFAAIYVHIVSMPAMRWWGPNRRLLHNASECGDEIKYAPTFENIMYI